MVAVKSGPSLTSLVTSNQIENFPFFLMMLTLPSWCRVALMVNFQLNCILGSKFANCVERFAASDYLIAFLRFFPVTDRKHKLLWLHHSIVIWLSDYRITPFKKQKQQPLLLFGVVVWCYKSTGKRSRDKGAINSARVTGKLNYPM